MQDKFSYSIGLMSGTSLDGIDLVYVKFNKEKYEDFQIVKAETVSYSNEWQGRLKEAINWSNEELKKLDVSYGKLLGETLNRFIEKNNINKIDFIASHGHTVLHQPNKGITLQVGNGQEIANITKCKIVCDFRTQDVALGGQGAPLVPIGDELLFSEYEYCINLGGFANVSYKENNKRKAFDICPVNIVMNHYCRKIGKEYDKNGELAAAGIVNKELLNVLNELDFYKKKAPKSLGLEWVKKVVFPLIDKYELEIPDVLATVVEHTSYQISKVILKEGKLLFTGGGAYNSYLMNRIKYYLNREIILQNNELIDYKEALIFAFLGLLRIENQVNCLKSVTGAKRNHSSGMIFYPKKN
ncbi:anhydro-N-acetylmuramic acid kinase [Tenacibaculum holothuriorum]|uniref:Anhydro-N-acetylmuramic acid kinase n=2 Tax=Tenacibaculum holothuriorum TaxID=1635173 RepID=A0A1Y2PCX7_9FLAO|nr:anhydro-N-acetylmuramic acid kinase [Tenacibaculum holothuriorum]